MIRVLGAVAAAYVGYSLGNVVKHQKEERPGHNVPEQRAYDDDVRGRSLGQANASTEDAQPLEGLEELQQAPDVDHVVNAYDDSGDSSGICSGQGGEDRFREESTAGNLPSLACAAEDSPPDLRSSNGGWRTELDSVEGHSTTSTGDVGLPCTSGSMQSWRGKGELTSSSSKSQDVDTSSRQGVFQPEPTEYQCGPETPIATDNGKLLLEDSPASADRLTQPGIGFSDPLTYSEVDSAILASACLQQGPQQDKEMLVEPTFRQVVHSPTPCLPPYDDAPVTVLEQELREHPSSDFPQLQQYLGVFQKEWTDLLRNERHEYSALVEAEQRDTMTKQMYLKTFEGAWIQSLKVEREERILQEETNRENRIQEEEKKRHALSVLQANNTKLEEKHVEIMRAKEQQKALADGTIRDLQLMLSTMEAENKMQSELLDQSKRRVEEVIKEEKANAEAKLKDLCLLLGKVESENLMLKNEVAEINGKMQDTAVEAGKVADSKLVDMQQELEQVKADHTIQHKQLLELKAKLLEAEQEKASLKSDLSEFSRETDKQRLSWEAELQSKLAEQTKLEQIKLLGQMTVELEERKRTQQLACQQQLDEDRAKQQHELQAEWNVKIKSHKEEITSFLVEETKKKLIDEREKWKFAQETEWKNRLDKEREQQRLLQEDKDRERKLVDDRIRKEGARLELRLSSVSAKEREIEQLKDAVQQAQREVDQRLREVEVLQAKTNLRDKLLKTTENDYFDEANFDRWISLKLGRRGETVFWYSIGELYDYPGGDLLVKVEGLEVTKSIVVERYKVHQVSRKVYLFRDKDTNEVLTEYQGGAVAPLIYKYQKMAYTFKGNVLLTEAASGQGEHLAPLRGNVVSLRHLKNSTLLVFTCPVFVNVRTARGVYQSYENHDYVMDKAEEDLSNHFSMIRFGSTPPFGENAVMHMTGWRLDSFDLLPKSMQQYIQTEHPTWTEAPLG